MNTANNKHFNQGDRVRLRRGHTEMVVIYVHPSKNEVVAQYFYKDHSTCYLNPYNAPSTKIRPAHEFVAWDGPETQDTTMSNRFTHTTSEQYPRRGIKRGVLTNGSILLEMADGHAVSFKPSELTEIVDDVFLARNIENGIKYNMSAPEGSGIERGNLLVDTDGKVFVVMNTKLRHNPTVDRRFEGKRFTGITI